MPTPTLVVSEFQVNTGTADVSGVRDMKIIGLSNGNFLVAWRENVAGVGTSAGHDIIGKIYAADGTVVTDSFQLNTVSVADDEDDFDIAATNDGGFAMLYVDDEDPNDDDGSGTERSALLWERYDSAGQSIASAAIASETSSDYDFRRINIEVDQTNNQSVITYTEPFNNSASDIDVFGATVTPAGVVTGPFSAAPNTTSGEFDAHLALLSNGEFVSAYRVGTEILYETSAQNGAATGSGSVMTGVNPVRPPDVAGLADGGFVVVAQTGNSIAGDIVMRISTNGGSFGSLITVANTSNNEDRPTVHALPDGKFVVVWMDQTASRIKGHLYQANGTTEGSQFEIGLGSPGVFDGYPDIGVTADGKLLFTWFENLFSNDIRAAVWDPRDPVLDMSDYARGAAHVLETNTVVGRVAGTTINGTSGNDTIIGQDEGDSVLAGEGNDSIVGEDGNDTLSGGGGADTIDGGAGADTLDGGSGTGDLLTYENSSAGVSVTLNGAIALFNTGGDAAGDVLSGFENLTGSNFNDTLTTASGANTILGLAGNDTIRVILGDDVAGELYDGGADTDTLILQQLSTPANFKLSDDIVQGFETLQLQQAGVGLRGDITVNLLASQAAQFTTFSGENNFFAYEIVIEMGSETMLDLSNANIIALNGVGDGFTVNGDSSDETIIGTVGNDTIFGGNGNDTIEGGAGADSLDGGGGDNFISYEGSSSGITLIFGQASSGGDAAGDSRANFENVIGSAHGDVISGGGGANTLIGGGDNDTLSGLASNDSIDGGTGNDTLFGGDDDDILDGGEGTDTLMGDLGNDTLRDSGGRDVLFGGGDDDLFLIFDGNGIDDISGDSGTDTYDAGALVSTSIRVDLDDGTHEYDNDGLELSVSGIEHVFGGQLGDELQGNSDNNTIQGNGGNDTINGGTGVDSIDGGAGNDTVQLTGGSNAVGENYDGGADIDTFEVNDTSTAATYNFRDDTILNFENLVLRDDSMGGIQNITALFRNDQIEGFSSISGNLAGANDVIHILQEGSGTFDLSTISVNGFTGPGDKLIIDSNVIGALITGSTIRDDITGTVSNDTISGRAGNDSIDGGAGNDIISGDEGNDTLVDGLGEDILYGGAGDDFLEDKSTALIIDQFFGGADNDTVRLGIFFVNDSFYGGSGIDTIEIVNTSFLGNDHFDLNSNGYFSNGFFINTFDGFENYDYSGSLNSNEQVTGTSGTNIISTGGGNNSINGLGGNDTISSGAGNDTIDGGAGNDTIEGGADADSIDGGADHDVLSYASQAIIGGGALGVFVDLENNFGVANNAQGDTFANIEEVIGTGDRDFLFGTSGSDTLRGGEQFDQLGGTDGGVTDTLDGGGGFDIVDYRTATTNFVVDLADHTSGSNVGEHTADVWVDIEGIFGVQDFTNRFIGSSAALEYLIGGSLGDTIDGNGGRDFLFGLGGNDTIDGGTDADLLFAGAGTDTVTGGTGQDVFYVEQNNGIDIITDWSEADDFLLFFQTGATAFADLTFTDTSPGAGGNVEITSAADPTFTVVVQNVELTDLDDMGRFIFA